MNTETDTEVDTSLLVHDLFNALLCAQEEMHREKPQSLESRMKRLQLDLAINRLLERRRLMLAQ